MSGKGDELSKSFPIFQAGISCHVTGRGDCGFALDGCAMNPASKLSPAERAKIENAIECLPILQARRCLDRPMSLVLAVAKQMEAGR